MTESDYYGIIRDEKEISGKKLKEGGEVYNIDNAWLNALFSLGARDKDQVKAAFEEIVGKYREPNRSYHTYDSHMLWTFTEWEDLEEETFWEDLGDQVNQNIIFVALILHDVIYDSSRTDNEQRSADYAYELLKRLGVSEKYCVEVRDIIVVTDHKTAPSSIEGQVLADLDLLILGSSWAVFCDYERAIRMEYAQYDDSAYVKGRIEFLKSMLAKDSLFYTTRFRDFYEGSARRNMRALVGLLEAHGILE